MNIYLLPPNMTKEKVNFPIQSSKQKYVTIKWISFFIFHFDGTFSDSALARASCHMFILLFSCYLPVTFL